ncbi:hypothetical protein [Planktothrix paucivesiculata]|uniref:Uncharacterized protein n=1 Tax=Planktothrix paucivesiculata PCC 9631 TaxID=671071 RepID=A0A7Z9E280_9CYAN|nr:hypothetical protein [Planktothrix paucivesiculata]VXD19540.1 conserved hypothetical protein [Planktothrix paucivesiculata PCC 9631]
MNKKDRIFTDIYKLDSSTHLYMIEIGLNHYTDIFNEWDPAPFKRREINPNLESYLLRSSDEVPFEKQIELCFMVSQGQRDEKMEKESRLGIKNSFTFKIYVFKKEIKQANSRIIYFVFVGLISLWMATIYSENSTAVFPSVLFQALVISGWVFIWEAISLLFFKNREFYHRYRTYKRLQNAPVIFIDQENSPALD